MPKVIHTDSEVSQTDFNRELHIIYKEDKDTPTDVDADEERDVDDDNEMNKFWKVFF